MRTVTHRIPGLVLTDHEFTVPLDYTRPDGEQITVFAREVVAPGKEDAEPALAGLLPGRPRLPVPAARRSLRLAQARAPGLPRPAARRPRHRPQHAGDAPDAGAGAAHPRRRPSTWRTSAPTTSCATRSSSAASCWGRRSKWSILGQSFGGFCVVHYLSAAPGGLREAIITGGLPPLDRPVDDIYRATYRRVLEKNRRYFERYPDDRRGRGRSWTIWPAHDVRLPGGGRLSPRRFQQLGIAFGASDGFEEVHYLLEDAFVEGRPAAS